MCHIKLLFAILITIFSLKILYADELIVLKKEYNDSSNSGQKYRIHIEYPQIDGISDIKIQDKINSEILSYWMKNILEFQKNLDNMKLNDNCSTLNWYDYYYEVHNTNEIFSFSFNIYEYYCNVQQTDIKCKTFNFDLTNASEIKLEDIFLKDSDFLNTLSSISKKNLKEWESEDSDENILDVKLFKLGTAPLKENFQIFNIQPDGLYFTFTPLQVAPYSQGLIHTLIPYKNLSKILNKTGRIGRIVK